MNCGCAARKAWLMKLFNRNMGNTPTDEVSQPYDAAPYGNPAVIFPGYGVNEARMSATDIWPTPISPQHYRLWTGLGIQLDNGWNKTNFGKKDFGTAASYRQMLYSSSDKGRNTVLPGQGRQPTGQPHPSTVEQMNMMILNSNDSADSGTGAVAPGVDLGGRAYYG